MLLFCCLLGKKNICFCTEFDHKKCYLRSLLDTSISVFLVRRQQCTVKKKSERASQMNDLMLTDFTLETLLSSLQASLPSQLSSTGFRGCFSVLGLLSTTIYVTEAMSIQEFKANALALLKRNWNLLFDCKITLKWSKEKLCDPSKLNSAGVRYFSELC